MKGTIEEVVVDSGDMMIAKEMAASVEAVIEKKAIPKHLPVVCILIVVCLVLIS